MQGCSGHASNIFETALRYRQLRKNERLDHHGIRRRQEDKLRRLVAHAYETVPYYRNLLDGAGVTTQSIQTLADLEKIPVTTKATLQAQERNAITSGAFRPEELVPEHTSGSTGRPFTVWFDRDYVVTRDALFLRTLRAAGYAFGQKALLITRSHPPKKSNRLLRWEYASILQTPAELLAALNRSKPDFLYGCVTPLRLLAEFIAESQAAFHRPRRILATAESLDRGTRSLLAETFGAEVFDFYGLTEMGPVGWECAAHQGYHLSEDTVLVEFLPLEGEMEGKRLVMTNLELLGMPLIRFETCDIGSPIAHESCPCGRSFAKIGTVAGRAVDCLRLPSGQLVPPYRLTCALEKLSGLKRYQLVQDEPDHFLLRAETDTRRSGFSNQEAYDLLRPILGQAARIEISRVPEFAMQPGRKFRVIESRLHKE